MTVATMVVLVVAGMGGVSGDFWWRRFWRDDF